MAQSSDEGGERGCAVGRTARRAGAGLPAQLKAAGTSGEVFVSFVVDTTGMADTTTFKVVKSTDQAFTDAVRAALPLMRFFPAWSGGYKVKQLVQLPFVFSVKAPELPDER